MSPLIDLGRQERQLPAPHVRDRLPARASAVTAVAPSPLSASQARAARRRAALRDEQAVSAWLRELAARPR
jgi:hypothetical protein